MKFASTFVIIFLLPFLHACNAKKEIKEAFNINDTQEGVWEAPAYGFIVDISKSKSEYTLKQYSTVKEYCFLSEPEKKLSKQKLDEIITLSKDKETFHFVEKGQRITPGITFHRIKKLPNSCAKTSLKLAGDAQYKSNPALDFELFWQTFNELYADFDRRKVNWYDIYQQNKHRVSSSTTETELFTIFSDMVKPLKDGHVFLVNGNNEFITTKKPMLTDTLNAEFIDDNKLTPPLSPAQKEAQNTYVTDSITNILLSITGYANTSNSIKSKANDNLVWFKTDNNIGYLLIKNMADFAGNESSLSDDIIALNTAIDEFIQDMQGTKGIIIDIRFNGGGYDENAMLIASRFVEQRRHVYSKQARLANRRTPLLDIYLKPEGKQQYTNPVVLLTSASSFSAAEVFALSMTSLPKVTLMGEATGGGFSDALPKRVTANILFSLSNEFYLTPNGAWYEGEGVPVDIPVSFLTRAERDNFRDYGIEKAEQFLLK